MKARDFEYDGRKLSSFGFVICNFGSKGLETTQNGGQSTFNTISTLDGKKHRLVSTKYEDCAENVIQICKTPCYGNVMEISQTELSEITRWLGRNRFLKLKILDENYINLYFEARFKISRIELDGVVYGFELEIETNAPFAFKEPKTINIEHTIESGNIHTIHVWKKYKVVRDYNKTETLIGTTEPSDCSYSLYGNYEITSDGYFILSNKSSTSNILLSGYHYISGQSTNAKSIYYEKFNPLGDNTYYLFTLGDTYTTEEKGGFVENISSESKNTYPEDGIQNDGTRDYWYTYLKADYVQDKDIFINDISQEEGYIYPYTEITVLEDGDLNIHNSMENRDTYIANCIAGEVITMDYPVIQSSVSSHNIQNDFNWNFFRVANTFNNSRNDLIISIPCIMKIKYSPIVKFGL